MIKLIIRFLLSLSIFLLSGHGQLVAHTYKENIFHSSLKNLDKTALICLSKGQHDSKLLSIKRDSSGTAQEGFFTKASVVEINEKENECAPCKKPVNSSRYFSTLIHAQLIEYTSAYIKNRLSFYKQFARYLSPEARYLLFRVFRL